MGKRISANGIFVFHQAGQGLFYSGTISLESPRNVRFDFVYDCGSTNRQVIKRAIFNYKQTVLLNNHIDMLVISHLHKDHVSGLDKLLEDTQVDYVFLPYLSPPERLILALMYQNMPSWYYEFLHDPVIYLLERNVEKVVLFGSGGEEEEGGPPPTNISPRPPKEEKEEKLLIKLRDEPDARRIFENEGSQDIYTQYIREGRLIVKAHRGYVVALGIWVFRFFNYKIPTASINNLYYCTQNILSNIRIKDAIRQKDSRKILKNCYERTKSSLDRDLNNTSLAVYHMPVGTYHAAVSHYHPSCCWWYCPVCYFRLFNNLVEHFGQFLTGDIDLNHDYSQVQRHFHHYFPHNFLVQIPHHGARRNWNNNILDDIPYPSLWVASAGIRSRFGHPHVGVVLDILYNGHCFAWSNESERVIIRGKVEWQ